MSLFKTQKPLLCCRKLLLLFTIIIASTFADAIVIRCTTQKNRWTNLGDIDECIVYYLKCQDYDDTITHVNIEARNILSFYIRESDDLYYIPSGIADHFVNLKVLVVAFTGLKALRQSDFKPLQNLENIYLDNNKLEFIEKDIFAYNPKIRFINLESNKIKSVAINVFEPLMRLQQLNFSGNICHQGKAESPAEVEILKKNIYEKCAPVDETEDFEYGGFETRETSEYSYVSDSCIVTSFTSVIILTMSINKFL